MTDITIMTDDAMDQDKKLFMIMMNSFVQRVLENFKVLLSGF